MEPSPAFLSQHLPREQEPSALLLHGSVLPLPAGKATFGGATVGREEGMHHLSRLRKDVAQLHPLTWILQQFGKSLFAFPIPS